MACRQDDVMIRALHIRHGLGREESICSVPVTLILLSFLSATYYIAEILPRAAWCPIELGSTVH